MAKLTGIEKLRQEYRDLRAVSGCTAERFNYHCRSYLAASATKATPANWVTAAHIVLHQLRKYPVVLQNGRLYDTRTGLEVR